MPSRISAWAVYDVFEVRDQEQIFLAVVSDTQWEIFCEAFGFADLKADPRLGSNNDRVRAREWMMPELRRRLAGYSAAELGSRFEEYGLPYAPITRPQDLFDDPHLVWRKLFAKYPHPSEGEITMVEPPMRMSRTPPEIRRTSLLPSWPFNRVS